MDRTKTKQTQQVKPKRLEYRQNKNRKQKPKKLEYRQSKNKNKTKTENRNQKD
jgi:hypothetical protein